MGKIIFITGSTRSGKSQLAVKMAGNISKKNVIFIATCMPQDHEMRSRILLHKKKRPAAWKTIQAGEDLLNKLKEIKINFKVVIIDCLTLFVSNLLMRGKGEREVGKKVRQAVEFLLKAPFTSILVSNEVGGGIVPENKLAREFRDVNGIANQIVAKYADEAYLVVAGIPLKIK